MAATIRDVAERAGVSVSTVSRVFNGYRFVGERTRERVLDAMAALDYRPDMVARSMRTGKTRAVGLVVDDFANPLFSAHAAHAEAVLRANGYSLMIANSERSPEQRQWREAQQDQDKTAARRIRFLQGHGNLNQVHDAAPVHDRQGENPNLG